MKSAGYIAVTLKFRKEGRRWTAFCEELGTATYARTIQEAKARIEEAIVLHLNTLEEMGEGERFLRENGIKFYSHKPTHKEIKCQFFEPNSFDPNSFYAPFIPPVPRELCA